MASTIIMDVRIVLSRKGFDTVAGKGASPVLPDGRMVSMPIPEPRPTPGAGPTYEETLVPGEDVSFFAELGRQCRLRAATGPAHVDPDLLPGARPRRPGWRAALGQADIAAAHLRNRGVGAGDLFLFFGLFAPFSPGGLRRREWFHSLFGYLQVDFVVDLHSETPVPDWLCDHPHVGGAGRASYRPNLLYVARERLDFAPDRPGWGVFRYRRGTPPHASRRHEPHGAGTSHLLRTRCGHDRHLPSCPFVDRSRSGSRPSVLRWQQAGDGLHRQR